MNLFITQGKCPLCGINNSTTLIQHSVCILYIIVDIIYVFCLVENIKLIIAKINIFFVAFYDNFQKCLYFILSVGIFV